MGDCLVVASRPAAPPPPPGLATAAPLGSKPLHITTITPQFDDGSN